MTACGAHGHYWRKMKAFLTISMIGAVLAASLSVPASAAEVPYTVQVAPGEKVTGIVNLNESTGGVDTLVGEASGVVNGKFELHSANTSAELTGTGFKLNVLYERRQLRLSAHLYTCASPDSCTPGPVVVLWEQK